MLSLSTTAYQLGFSGRAQPAHAAASQVRMDVADVPGLVAGQKYGPTAPAHPAVKPWTNLETQEGVQLIKAKSDLLRQPLLADMADDEIFVSKDSIHILKHHGSYMQQNRELKKKADRDQSYQFMLRLKVPCGEVPAAVFRELDDLSNTHGQGDLRATTRQAFQLHGVIKGNLKEVISRIANVGARRRLAVARRRRPPAAGYRPPAACPPSHALRSSPSSPGSLGGALPAGSTLTRAPCAAQAPTRTAAAATSTVTSCCPPCTSPTTPPTSTPSSPRRPSLTSSSR